MNAVVESLLHRDEDTPLCPRMVRLTQPNPREYLCDLPADLRKRFLGETPCSVCAGCVPREQAPEAVQDALLDEHRRKFHLRAPR